MNALDRTIMTLAPRWGLKRAQWRAAAELLDQGPSLGGRRRHYDAAQRGRRTEHWKRSATDANAAQGPALHVLRNLARDLCRNDPWARRAKQVIVNNTVGWGITPRPQGAGVRAMNRAVDLWEKWAGSTQCDYSGRMNMAGLQRLVMKTTVESGEAIVQRYRRRLSDGLAIPLQLQVLEPDFLDTAKDGIRTPGGGRIIQGIELDAQGQVVAYWMFPEHPGQQFLYSRMAPASASRRILAEDICHVYDIERAGGVRGVTWYAPTIADLEGFGVYKDAQLMKQQVAACLVGAIIDVDGSRPALGPAAETPTPTGGTASQTMEPGTWKYIPQGSDIRFSSPPAVPEGALAELIQSAVAMGMGVTLEDLTGNYRQMPFSAARMSRLSHWGNVESWRWQMLVPQFCDRSWYWAMETAAAAGLIGELPAVAWSPPPMAAIEPDRESLADQRDVRNGRKTPDEMVLAQGNNPATFWKDYAESFKRLDDLGIILDCDPRRTTQQGNPVVREGASKKGIAGNAGSSKE